MYVSISKLVMTPSFILEGGYFSSSSFLCFAFLFVTACMFSVYFLVTKFVNAAFLPSKVLKYYGG